jgi:hypothetical protein
VDAPHLDTVQQQTPPAGIPKGDPATGTFTANGNQLQWLAAQVPAWVKVIVPLLIAMAGALGIGGGMTICKTTDGGKTYVPVTNDDRLKAIEDAVKKLNEQKPPADQPPVKKVILQTVPEDATAAVPEDATAAVPEDATAAQITEMKRQLEALRFAWPYGRMGWTAEDKKAWASMPDADRIAYLDNPSLEHWSELTTKKVATKK